ncbi:cytochrome P450 [Xylariales sp. PMI_506]|nr:cytochrome P450 [Xylariales sp. PMI_506]
MSTTGLAPLTLLIGLGVYVIHAGVSSLLAYRRNLHAAKVSGLPYITRVIAETSYVFIVLQPLVDRVIGAVPRSWDPAGRLDYYRKDWRIKYKYEKHALLGDVFWNVSPGLLTLEIADPQVCTEVLTKRKEFQKNMDLLALICFFGPNIVACNEIDWKRYRRVVGPQFSEDLNELVWKQTTSLAHEMFESWDKGDSTASSKPQPPLADGKNKELKDLCQLALRVVTGSIFQTMVPYSLEAKRAKGEILDDTTIAAANFSRSFQMVLDNIITLTIFPRWLLGWTGAHGKELNRSFDELADYMSSSVKRAAKEESEGLNGNSFLTTLTNALPADGQPSDDSTELSFDEILGNLFILGLAGSETTAVTIHYALIMLAMNPEVQSWLAAQLDDVRAEFGTEWGYRQAVTKLKCIHYIMMETLRLYPVTQSHTRLTMGGYQTLHYNGQQIALPKGTTTVIGIAALHYSPKYWGDSVHEFRPQRWMSQQETGSSDGGAGDVLVEGAFVPFGHGPRACLGRRFSETEFMAVLAALLADHTVELAVGPGETAEAARARAQKALDDSEAYMTVSVKGWVPLRFVKRTVAV